MRILGGWNFSPMTDKIELNIKWPMSDLPSFARVRTFQLHYVDDYHFSNVTVVFITELGFLVFIFQLCGTNDAKYDSYMPI